jgi:uncharacterized GH25 family protein
VRNKHLLGAAIVAVCVASSATAHFIWIESSTGSEGLVVRAGFGDAGSFDVKRADYIKAAKYFVRTSDGKETPFEVLLDAERGYYHGTLSENAPKAIIGSLARISTHNSKQPFLLKYYAKHLVGPPSSWSEKIQGSERLAIEVFARPVEKGIELEVKAGGKPLADATLNLFGPKEKGKLKTDAAGKAIWANEGAGDYALYVGKTTQTAGKFEGQEYSKVSEYATLTFRL